MSSSSSRRIAVVGAGISGLTCAYELQKAGFEVLVFEREEHVGGRMWTREQDGLLFDIGADHLIPLYKKIVQYAHELEIPFEQMDFLKYKVLRSGDWHSTTKVVGWASRLRLIREYWRLPEGIDFFDFATLADFDTENALQFMRRRMGQEVADYLGESFCATYQFHRLNELSAAVVLGMMRSLKDDMPRWYLHRMKGGMKALPQALADRLDVRLGQAVRRVESGSTPGLVFDSGEESFDAVVMACQGSALPALLASPSASQQQFMDVIRYASTITVVFQLPEKALGDGAVFWVPFRESGKICSFINQAYKGEGWVKDGQTTVSVWLHEAWAKELMERDDGEVYQAVLAEFVRICPELSDASQLKAFDLQRWPSAMPKFYHGYLKATQSFLNQGQGEQGIWLTGDYLNGIWTEGAVSSGQQVADQIQSALG